jgi:hypothetical protein
MRIDLPEGVRMGLIFYCKSDKDGLNCTFKLEGMRGVDVEKLSPEFIQKTINEQLPDFVADWRLMTDKEINEYQADEAEEARSDRAARAERED